MKFFRWFSPLTKHVQQFLLFSIDVSENAHNFPKQTLFIRVFNIFFRFKILKILSASWCPLNEQKKINRFVFNQKFMQYVILKYKSFSCHKAYSKCCQLFDWNIELNIFFYVVSQYYKIILWISHIVQQANILCSLRQCFILKKKINITNT